MSNGDKPRDDDPFADNPEAEFAPTQAMDAIPPAGERPATPPQAAPRTPPDGAPPRPTAYVPAPEKRFGVSAVLSLVGGLVVLVSFALPMFNMTYVFEEAARDSRLDLERLEDLDDLPEGELDPETRGELEMIGRELGELAREEPILEAAGIDVFVESLSKAATAEEALATLRAFNISAYGTMQVFRALDADGERYGADSEARAGARGIWIALLWILLSGVLAIVLVAVRVLRPLNALQIGWNGLFGFLWTVGGAAALVLNPVSPVFGVTLFHPLGAAALILGGALLWVSAFAGMTSHNWWKAPLIALGLLALVGAAILVPAMMLVS